MSNSSRGGNPEILHLSAGSDLGKEIDRLLGQADLRAHVVSDPYRAMGWLASRRPARAKAVILDHGCLADDERDFVRLAMDLVPTRTVYVYGRGDAFRSDPAVVRCGARTILTPEQTRLMIGELDKCVGRAPVGGPAGRQETATPAATTLRPEPIGEQGAPADRDESDSGDRDSPRLRLSEAGSPDVNPEVDALAKAASESWPQPVLNLVESEGPPIAKILPDAEPQEPAAEVPTPWSPSPKRPERKPPSAKTDGSERVESEAQTVPASQAPADDTAEPILTPEELEALLGPDGQA